MGKLLCDSTTVAESFQGSSPIVPWKDPKSAPLEAIKAVDLVNQTSIAAVNDSWEDVIGLEEQQRRHLQRFQSKGVLWKAPEDEDSSTLRSVVFRLYHGGEVSADGNCLFTASQKAMCGEIDARDLRKRTVSRFLEDLGSATFQERESIDDAIRHMYSPDLRNGWGVHVVQEVKLLASKGDRVALDSAIDELVHLGMQREMAAESIYKERCTPVNDGHSWAKYMLISGSPDDEHDIITLQYTEEGLLSVDENREGHAAAFGDDIAIECLAILKSINFSLREKSFGLIFGQSGSGKTTLLQLLAGITKPTSGSIYIQKYDSDGKPNQSSLPLVPERVGIVFQFPERYFVADNVLDEVTFGWPRQKGDYQLKEHLALRLQRAINWVGLSGISLDKDPHSLSGGYKRRLALAIQLVHIPDLLILDEPLAGLDWKARADVVKLLKHLKKELSVLVVSHDLRELASLVDRSWRMEIGGKLREESLPL